MLISRVYTLGVKGGGGVEEFALAYGGGNAVELMLVNAMSAVFILNRFSVLELSGVGSRLLLALMNSLGRYQFQVLRDGGLIDGRVLTSGGDVAALHRFAGREVLRLDWRFCGERFFVALVGRVGKLALGDFLVASRAWRA